MKVLPSTDPDVMLLRASNGCFGVIGMLVGALLCVCVFVPGSVRGGDDFPWYIGLPVGLIFVAVGTYRRTIRIDRNAGNVTLRKSVTGYTYQQTKYSLNAFDSVSLGHIRRSSGSSGRPASRYDATLTGGSSLRILESGIVEHCRAIAEPVAVFLQLKLIDSVTGNVIVRDPELLQLSVGQRARKSGNRQPIPKTPTDLQTELDILDDATVVLKIPPAGWSTRMMLSMWTCWLMGGFFLWLVFLGSSNNDREPADDVMKIVVTLFSCLCIFGSIAFVLSYFTRRVTVTVSPQTFRLDSASLIRRYHRILPADEIQDVVTYNVQRLGQSATGNSRPTNFMIGGVGIRTDKITLNFGNHLSEAEQKFLSQLIRAVLERVLPN